MGIFQIREEGNRMRKNNLRKKGRKEKKRNRKKTSGKHKVRLVIDANILVITVHIN